MESSWSETTRMQPKEAGTQEEMKRERRDKRGLGDEGTLAEEEDMHGRRGDRTCHNF